MKELICIVCPKGCHLQVADDLTVTGNQCPRGVVYGKAEVTNPVRTLTSTVRISGGLHSRLPVKSSADLPKALIADVMKLLDEVCLKSPVHTADVVLKNVLNTCVDIVATRNL